MNSLTIEPLNEKHLQEVVRIHRAVLGYTFNSILGHDHLLYIYRLMAQIRDAYIGVALYNGQPAGVISGVLDPDKIKSRLLSEFRFHQWGNLIWKVIVHPSLIHEWWMGNIIGKPLYIENREIKPTLTAIAVDENFHGNGIGRQLVYELEKYFNNHQVNYYRLDTLIENKGARKFYKALGFHEVTTRANSVICVKRASHE